MQIIPRSQSACRKHMLCNSWAWHGLKFLGARLKRPASPSSWRRPWSLGITPQAAVAVETAEWQRLTHTALPSACRSPQHLGIAAGRQDGQNCMRFSAAKLSLEDCPGVAICWLQITTSCMKLRTTSSSLLSSCMRHHLLRYPAMCHCLQKGESEQVNTNSKNLSLTNPSSFPGPHPALYCKWQKAAQGPQNKATWSLWVN